MSTKKIFFRLGPSVIAIMLVSLTLAGCKQAGTQVGVEDPAMAAIPVLAVSADDVMVVDCLLPGQVRKLGRMNYLTPRRPLRTTALECEIRGGEYVAYDRSDLATSLAVWLPQAKAGDQQAQTYVGEIYQRGMGAEPNYKKAAQWFEKAAQQGYPRAQMSLGNLYEQGLGVPRDPQVALSWYRQATGLEKSLSLDTVSTNPEALHELERLKEEVERQKAQRETLAHKLEDSERALTQTRKQVEQQSRDALREKRLLETSRAELDRGRAALVSQSSQALTKMEVELNRHRAQLDQRQQEIAQLNRKVETQKSKAEKYRQTVSQFQAKIEKLAVSTNPDTEQELVRLREEVERQKTQREAMNRQLNESEKALSQTRKQVAQQSRDVQREKKQLETSRAELDRKRTESARISNQALTKMEAELDRRQAQLNQRQQEIARLNLTIETQKAEADKYRQTATQFQAKIENLPPPKIELYDPVLVATRGIEIRKAPVKSESKNKRLIGKVWAPAGLVSFRVNQSVQTPAEDGSFTVMVPIDGQDGKKVELVAVDANGKEGRLSLELALRRGTPAAPSPQQREKFSFDFGKFYALVIGNNEYQHLPKLKTAVNDARQIADLLKTRYGFETTLLLNAGRADILLTLDRFRKQLTEKDNFLIYYAGHGELDQTNQRGYWLPVDAATDSTVQWIRTDQITDTLNLMSPLRSLVIADACYSGIMTRSAMTRLESGKSDELRYNLIKILAKKRARVVLSSGGLKPVLDSGSQGHSVYAGSLLKILSANDDILKAQELHHEVTKNVAFASEKMGLLQVPQYGGLIHSGHEMGDFIFVPENGSAVGNRLPSVPVGVRASGSRPVFTPLS